MRTCQGVAIVDHEIAVVYKVVESDWQKACAI